MPPSIHPNAGDGAAFTNALVEAINNRRYAVAARFWAATFDSMGSSAEPRRLRREAVLSGLCDLATAFPDFTIVANEVHSDGGRVVVSWTAKGTHRNSFLNIPPTGREVTVDGVFFYTLDKNGRIASQRYLWDVAALLRHLKLLPDWPPSVRSKPHTKPNPNEPKQT